MATRKKKPRKPRKPHAPAHTGGSGHANAGGGAGAGGAHAGGGKKTVVRVRMYRQGLGDCHLITFDPDGSPVHVLVDCGSLGATTTGVKLDDVAKDIRDTTNKHLHLLIATHEHHDHVSAFKAGSHFDEISVDRVWLAWTENPKDPLAQSLAKNKNDIGKALAAAAAAKGAGGAGGAAAESRRGISGLMSLFGGAAGGGPLAAGSFSESVNLAMEYVRTKKGAQVEYLNPGGTAREEAWLPGFRVYVLGPPRDKTKLYDLGGHDSAELYGLIGGLGAAADYASVGASFAEYLDRRGDSEAAAQFEKQLPFDPRFRVEIPEPAAEKRFGGAYYDPAAAWRRIDGDWLDSAEQLALQLDSATNNTSLVLAFERIADGKVVLFPADAQQGNWLSWHDPALKLARAKAGGGTEPMTAADLLKRTVFYKVGHHSSHNATAKGKGLELMEQTSELTAFIPVDRAVALTRNPPDSWQMPARPLYRKLLEHTQGRVVRSDLGWAADSKSAAKHAVEQAFDGMATAAEWATWAKAQKAAETSGSVKVSPLYVEYRLS